MWGEPKISVYTIKSTYKKNAQIVGAYIQFAVPNYNELHPVQQKLPAMYEQILEVVKNATLEAVFCLTISQVHINYNS